MGYSGSKAAPGLCQAIISLMPPHSVYIEAFPGGGAIMKRKPPAERSTGIDLDPAAVGSFSCGHPVEPHHGCALRFLAGFPFQGSELVHCDLPYPRHPPLAAAPPLRLVRGRPCGVPGPAEGAPLQGDGVGTSLGALRRGAVRLAAAGDADDDARRRPHRDLARPHFPTLPAKPGATGNSTARDRQKPRLRSRRRKRPAHGAHRQSETHDRDAMPCRINEQSRA